jgi:hypothetical protein
MFSGKFDDGRDPPISSCADHSLDESSSLAMKWWFQDSSSSSRDTQVSCRWVEGGIGRISEYDR